MLDYRSSMYVRGFDFMDLHSDPGRHFNHHRLTRAFLPLRLGAQLCAALILLRSYVHFVAPSAFSSIHLHTHRGKGKHACMHALIWEGLHCHHVNQLRMIPHQKSDGRSPAIRCDFGRAIGWNANLIKPCLDAVGGTCRRCTQRRSSCGAHRSGPMGAGPSQCS